MDGWPAAEPFGAGWSIALRIIIPEEDSHTIAPVSGSLKSIRAIQWIPRPDPGMSVVLHIIIAEPDRGDVLLKEGIQ
jgi:hypothetical protein